MTRKYFMINLHEGMGPSWDRTYDPWISNQTRLSSQIKCWVFGLEFTKCLSE